MQDDNGIIIGAEVKDVLSGNKVQVFAKQVINATGPFSDSMRQMSDPAKPSIIMPSAGQLPLICAAYKTLPAAAATKSVQCSAALLLCCF